MDLGCHGIKKIFYGADVILPHKTGGTKEGQGGKGDPKADRETKDLQQKGRQHQGGN